MPAGEYFGDDLRQAVLDSEVSMATLDDKVRRILRQMVLSGALDDRKKGGPGEANTPRHQALARRIAAEGTVLLKRQDSTLPLDRQELSSIAVIGPRADAAKVGGGGSSEVIPPYSVSPLDGIRERAGSGISVEYAAREEGEQDPVDLAVELAWRSDVAIVIATDDSTEGADRDSLELPGRQNELISAVASVNDRTVVVLRTGGPVLMPWIEEVPNVLETWYPGMEEGNALASVLFGDVNPSGKLPVTFGIRPEDYPTNTQEQYPGVNGIVDYSEGIFVGYRHFDQQGIEPLFAFGHGLSYTSFDYRNLSLRIKQASREQTVSGNGSTRPSSLNIYLDVEIQNVGPRKGAEVVQLYLHAPGKAAPMPPKQLRGFQKVFLEPGQSERVSSHLDERALSYWDTDAHDWVVQNGTYHIMVGSSSRDIRLRDSFSIER
jgi:beta-glucosidase